MSINEKTTFGVTVEPTHTTTDNQLSPPRLHTAISKESDLSTDVSPIDTPYTPDARNPFSSSPVAPPTQTYTQYDLESQYPYRTVTNNDSTTHLPKASADIRVKHCQMWPTKDELHAQAKHEKRQNGCFCFRKLTRKQRLAAQILIALLVIGMAVGIGVGISRAVGGGVWAGEHQTKTIPQDGQSKSS